MDSDLTNELGPEDLASDLIWGMAFDLEDMVAIGDLASYYQQSEWARTKLREIEKSVLLAVESSITITKQQDRFLGFMQRMREEYGHG